MSIRQMAKRLEMSSLPVSLGCLYLVSFELISRFKLTPFCQYLSNVGHNLDDITIGVIVKVETRGAAILILRRYPGESGFLDVRP